MCVCISVLRIFFLNLLLFRKSLVPEKIQIKREVILVILKLTIVSFEDLCCIFLVGTWLIFPWNRYHVSFVDPINGVVPVEQKSLSKPISVDEGERQEGKHEKSSQKLSALNFGASSDNSWCNFVEESAPPERQVSPEKLYRAAVLRNRFADTIFKAKEKALEKVCYPYLTWQHICIQCFLASCIWDVVSYLLIFGSGW